MICFAEHILTEDLYIVHKEKFSITCYICDRYIWQRRSVFIRQKSTLSSERKLHKDYGCKGSVAKKRKKNPTTTTLAVSLKRLGAKTN
jgi:hypothetical protein